MPLQLEAATRLGGLDLVVALAVAHGECLAVAGPSGAGKSSALRVAAGLLRPARGRVVCGEDVWLDTDRGIDVAPEERRCGYVFQDYALFPHLSARQNVAYALRDRGRHVRRTEAQDWLDRLGLGGLGDARPATLSGGERQRVALARALARRPRVLVLDEPLAALDARTRAAAARRLGEVLRETAVPTLLVTHDFAQAAQLGDRVAVLDAGRVVQEGTATDLAARPASAFVADFTGAVVLTGRATREPDGTTTVTLPGGERLRSTDTAEGDVAATVFPWELTVEHRGASTDGSAQNHLDVRVESVTTIGGRVRLGLAGPQPLAAEVSTAAVAQLALRPGAELRVSWKAAATRLVALR